jgi:hypothetical protein
VTADNTEPRYLPLGPVRSRLRSDKPDRCVWCGQRFAADDRVRDLHVKGAPAGHPGQLAHDRCASEYLRSRRTT